MSQRFLHQKAKAYNKIHTGQTSGAGSQEVGGSGGAKDIAGIESHGETEKKNKDLKL